MDEQRFVVTDGVWARLEPHLSGKKSDSGVTAKDNRLFVEAVLYRYRAGIPWRDLPERQRSMRAVFDYSWRMLGEAEQAVLMRLSIFQGGFTREAAEQVTGASLRALMSLMNKSLLSRNRDIKFFEDSMKEKFGYGATLVRLK